jgi:hypothetical protein
MLEIGLSSRSSWRNIFPLLTSWWSFFSSTGLDSKTSYGYSWKTSWGPTSTSSSKSEIT